MLASKYCHGHTTNRAVRGLQPTLSRIKLRSKHIIYTNNKHKEGMNTNHLMCIYNTRVRVMCVLIDNGSVDIFFANNRSC